MLTADLVRARVRRGVLEPQYVDAANPDTVALAARMIAIFEAAVDRPRRELETELREFLGTGTAFQLHRGLAKLLRDRCELEVQADIPPEELRATAFRKAAAAYREGDRFRFDRESVRAAICDDTELDAERFERNLYADLKDEQILTRFDACKPDWLLARYNIALAQAALLRANRLVIRVGPATPERFRALFTALKFHRLLHEVRSAGEGTYEITIDGPLSLFKSSQKYGVQMAMFLPTLLHFDPFEIEANVLHGPKRREVRFRLDSSAGLRPIAPLRGQWKPEEVGWLTERFTKLESDWEISDEAELIDLGGQGVLVADHTFTHRPTGLVVALELLGHWRRGSLRSRLEVLKEHAPRDVILALSTDLHVDDDELEDLPAEVVPFKTTPIARDVLAALDRILTRG